MYEHEEREHVDSLQTLAESKHTGQLLSVHLIDICTIFFPDCTECCQVNLSNNCAQILVKERKGQIEIQISSYLTLIGMRQGGFTAL